jgi:hypothetical protein
MVLSLPPLPLPALPPLLHPFLHLLHFRLLLLLLLLLRVEFQQCPPVLEGVSTGGWCAYNLDMGPVYPGLHESEECASWSVLHWISSLD